MVNVTQLPLLSSTVTAFNRKKHRFMLDLLCYGYEGAFSIQLLLCALLQIFFLSYVIIRSFHIVRIEPVIQTPLLNDWTGFSAGFVAMLKGICRSLASFLSHAGLPFL